jgi:predicted NAD/FAD-dependent oxidoreductase
MSVQYYANADTNGNIIGYYNDDIWDVTKIPTTAIKITEAQWQDAVANQGKYLIQSGAFVLAPAPTTAQLLASAQTAKIAELNTKCGQVIVSGFVSSALGVAHTYPSDLEAQGNLGMALKRLEDTTLASIYFKTIDTGYLAHTKTQLTQVFYDGFDYGNVQITHYNQLKAQVNAATTVAQVQAIVW